MGVDNYIFGNMCLGYPGKIIDIQGDYAKVNFGNGVIKDNILIALVDAKVGDYVIVHAGYAIQVLNEDEAREVLETWREYLNKAGDIDGAK